jgi:hypothetical protein
MGHSPPTFMRYVRANDETARTAIDKMVAGLPPPGQPLAVPTANPETTDSGNTGVVGRVVGSGWFAIYVDGRSVRRPSRSGLRPSGGSSDLPPCRVRGG